MKKYFFLLTLLAAIPGIAQTKQTKNTNLQPKNTTQCGKVLQRPIPLYEIFDNEGTNFGVRGDLLYMVYSTPVLTYAAEQSTTATVLNSKILDVPGKLSLGCDIALTYTMKDTPGYSFKAGWYHIVSQFSRTTTASNLLPSHIVGLTAPTAGTGSVNAHLTINLFDLLIKKDFGLGDWVSFSPAAGIVGGFLKGKSAANFQATAGSFSTVGVPAGTTAVTTASLGYNTDFEGIGLKLGANSAFKIWKGLKLKTDLFYNVLYGLSKVDLDYSQNGLYAGILSGVDTNYSQHNCIFFFDSLLALSWEQRFKNDEYFLDVHAGWRFQTYSSGWFQAEAEFNDSIREFDIAGQGLQAGVSLKF